MIPLRYYLPSATELRAIGQRYRPGPASNALVLSDDRWQMGPKDTDETLLDLLDEPFESVEDVAERLAGAERHLRERDDRRSVFLTVYAEMTRTVADGIDGDHFRDPAWIRRYLVTFADYYRRALAAFERGRSNAVPGAWRLGFGASLGGGTLLAQDALLGINAHINYDLAYTLCDVSIDPDRRARWIDHVAVNEILRRLTDAVQSALAEVYEARGLSQVDAVLGRFDETVALSGLVQARRLAWRNAVLLADGGALSGRFVDWRVRAVSTGTAHFVLAPTLDRSVLWRLRELERGDPLLDATAETFRRRVRHLDVGDLLTPPE